MPDIIGVEEMQDNNGTINDGTTDASLSAKRIIDAVLEIRGPKYEYVEIAPHNNLDGGAPGANIRVGFFYNPSRVKLAAVPKLLDKMSFALETKTHCLKVHVNHLRQNLHSKDKTSSSLQIT